MLILSLRTDKPEAELGLFDGDQKLDYAQWDANRQLAATVHTKIKDMLQAHGKQLEDVQGIVVFQGPGSFTGLRIGLTTADVMAYGLSVPIAAAMDEDWAQRGIARLLAGEDDDRVVLPHYGAPVHITQQKK